MNYRSYIFCLFFFPWLCMGQGVKNAFNVALFQFCKDGNMPNDFVSFADEFNKNSTCFGNFTIIPNKFTEDYGCDVDQKEIETLSKQNVKIIIFNIKRTDHSILSNLGWINSKGNGFSNTVEIQVKFPVHEGKPLLELSGALLKIFVEKTKSFICTFPAGEVVDHEIASKKSDNINALSKHSNYLDTKSLIYLIKLKLNESLDENELNEIQLLIQKVDPKDLDTAKISNLILDTKNRIKIRNKYEKLLNCFRNEEYKKYCDSLFLIPDRYEKIDSLRNICTFYNEGTEGVSKDYIFWWEKYVGKSWQEIIKNSSLPKKDEHTSGNQTELVLHDFQGLEKILSADVNKNIFLTHIETIKCEWKNIDMINNLIKAMLKLKSVPSSIFSELVLEKTTETSIDKTLLDSLKRLGITPIFK